MSCLAELQLPSPSLLHAALEASQSTQPGLCDIKREDEMFARTPNLGY